MHKQSTIAPLAAKLAAHIGIAVVNALLCAPFGAISNGIPVDLAGFKNGSKINENALIKCDLARGDLFKAGKKIANTCELFEKFINTVKHRVLGTAGKGHARICCTDAESVIARESVVVSDGDGVATVCDGDALHLQIFLQFFFCIHLGFGVACDDRNFFESNAHLIASFYR